MWHSFLMRLSLALTTGMIVVACASPSDMSTASTTSTPVLQTAEFVDDAVINSTVRAALRSERGLLGGRIIVASFHDVVQLDGSVDNARAKLRAGEIAADVPGVKSVRNNIIVK